MLAEVFTTADAEWRGLGAMPQSGLELRPAYAGLDARRRFAIRRDSPPPTAGRAAAATCCAA